MRVLHFISTINDNGGVQRVLTSYLLAMKKMDIQNTIIAHGNADSKLANELKSNGCEIRTIMPRSESGRSYFQALYNEIKKLDYDILHIHIGYKGIIPLWISRRCHPESKVIVHIHSNRKGDPFLKRLIVHLCAGIIKRQADALFACGKDAAVGFYGKKSYENRRVFIMRNAISKDTFSFSREARASIREELGIANDTLVFGHVGTFYEPKNQLFLIDVFRDLSIIHKNSVLVIVGGGKLEKQLKERVASLGLKDRVLFTGVRNDVPRLLSAFDAFLLPSIFEGFPMSLIEAQCSGLMCFTSTNVTSEVNVSGHVFYQSLGKKAGDCHEESCRDSL